MFVFKNSVGIELLQDLASAGEQQTANSIYPLGKGGAFIWKVPQWFVDICDFEATCPF